ncbi:MAG: hypothetical protein QNJ55_25060 [Xenococcus sp. MO_188.B8]|nr:hypothetical protein [Xenococcus sp. MO_188.B8]
MNEKRLEAYYQNLIDALLKYPCGEQPKFLNAKDESIKLLLQLLRVPLDSEDYENCQRIIVSLLEVNI